MTTCILYFDIGNTNTKIGVDRGAHSLTPYVVPTRGRNTADSFGLMLLEILRHMNLSPVDVSGALAASVVPEMSLLVKEACRRFLHCELAFTPEDVPIPLENRYARPHEVGADRLVGAYAARRLFPESFSLISVDFGTATTFDCVEDNAYLGGLICPGLMSSLSALAAGTAKLPGISLEVTDPAPVPGRSTSVSINHGFIFGFAAMAEGLIARLAQGMRGPTLTVGTGGFAGVLAKVTDCFQVLRPDLLLEGLRLLYCEHHSPR